MLAIVERTEVPQAPRLYNTTSTAYFISMQYYGAELTNFSFNTRRHGDALNIAGPWRSITRPTCFKRYG